MVSHLCLKGHTKLLHILNRIKILRRKLFFAKGVTVDVGAGHNPSIFSSVLIEKYLDDTIHRQGQALYLGNKIFVEADITCLPFSNNAFDFSVCSHVLEHVEDPVKAVSELTRISSSGYVELPSKASEYLFDRSDHLWVCSHGDDNKVLFEAKTDNFSNGFSQIFKEIIKKFGKAWYSFYFISFHYWVICHEWKGTFSIDVNGTPLIKREDVSQSDRLVDYSSLVKIERVLKRLLHKALSKKISVDDVVKLMQCNVCNEAFSRNENMLQCSCGEKYNIKGNCILVKT